MRGMSRASRAIAGGLTAAAILGLALCLVPSALAAVTGSTVGAPGFFSASAGPTAVAFTPDRGGAALGAFGAAIVSVLAARRS